MCEYDFNKDFKSLKQYIIRTTTSIIFAVKGIGKIGKNTFMHRYFI